MLAGDPCVAAATLIDPVDMTPQTRSMGYPSACLCGSCNPVDEGYRKFWGVLGAGSWQQVIAKAGHMQFTSLSGPVGWALDKLCGSGKISHQDVMAKTSHAAVAWLDQCFYPERAAQGLPTYMAWLQQQATAGDIKFDVKSAADVKVLNENKEVVGKAEGVQKTGGGHKQEDSETQDQRDGAPSCKLQMA
eukprot:gene24349-9966_t